MKNKKKRSACYRTGSLKHVFEPSVAEGGRPPYQPRCRPSRPRSEIGPHPHPLPHIQRPQLRPPPRQNERRLERLRPTFRSGMCVLVKVPLAVEGRRRPPFGVCQAARWLGGCFLDGSLSLDVLSPSRLRARPGKAQQRDSGAYNLRYPLQLLSGSAGTDQTEDGPALACARDRSRAQAGGSLAASCRLALSSSIDRPGQP